MESAAVSHKLNQYPRLLYSVSSKEFGNLSFQHSLLGPRETILNRKRFFSALDISPKHIVNVALVHGQKIYWVANKDKGRGSLSKSSLVSFYDGLACNLKETFLMVTIADCFPVFFFDPIKNCIGLVHAGWRGVLNNISKELVRTLQKKAGSNPKDIIAFIGPGLQPCHFEIQSDVFTPFFKHFGKKVAFKNREKKWLNLPLAIKIQLLELGLTEGNIEASPLCSYCERELFSSFRRDKDKYTAQGAIIGLFD